MTVTIEQIRTLRKTVPAATQAELAKELVQDPQGAYSRLVGIASKGGLSITVSEAESFVKTMAENNEFEDVELDSETLAAVSGGGTNVNINV